LEKAKRNLLRKRNAFTLIEVMIAMAILLVIIISVLMLSTFSVYTLKDSEALDMAKNIAVYSVEYIRSRNATWPDNPLGLSQDDFKNDATKNYPGLMDLWATPLRPNGDLNDTINVHPATPSQAYQALPKAFYFSLQGYVSLASTPGTSNPSREDGNLYVCDEPTKHYHDILTNNRILLKFPLTSTDSNAIKNFTALPGYNGLIYTTDTDKTNPSKQEYNPHYTNNANQKAGAMAYRGFRVLTQIVARKKIDSTSTHVEYYDVKVTVFWITGGKEHSYSIATQITTYGGESVQQPSP
jgi:prepilin-type N-terminal cleavage/methylation domain-containing protein